MIDRLLPLLVLCVPLTYLVGALAATAATPFHAARRAAALGAGLAWCGAIGVMVLQTTWTPQLGGFGGLGLRLDAVTGVLLPLVGTLGLVVVRFSATYLRDEPGRAGYTRALLGVLAAVSLLVAAGNLVALWLAWVATSLALHRLLTFFAERPQAILAAHKKFLVSRLADLCLLIAFGLIGATVGSLQLDAIATWVGAHPQLPPALQGAALLLVAGACLKSAQLPFHGWLLQVMEAPTPVSALLHAGVVNLGGVLMIRLAPLMARAPLAQAVLVAVGMATAVLAAMVMTTRCSIKVMLAWSTCAQMGFMLVECGLGAWRLALVHLVAHSIYKAHAFLGSGDTVEAWQRGHLVAPAPPLPPWRLVAGGAALMLAAWAEGALGASWVGRLGDIDAGLAALLGLSLLPLAAATARGGWRDWLGLPLAGLGLTALYFGWHLALGALPLDGAMPEAAAPSNALALIPVGVGLCALVGLQTLLLVSPAGRWTRALHQWLFAGLYLDERFTRLTFWLWPPQRPVRGSSEPPAAAFALPGEA